MAAKKDAKAGRRVITGTLNGLLRLIGADFHSRVRNMYKKVKEKTGRKRLKMLLSYLERHENRFEKGVRDFKRGRKLDPEKQKILENWHQYVPADEKLSTEGLELRPDMSPDEVVDTAMELDRRLVDFFENQAHNPNMPDALQQIFRKMAEQEKQEKAELAKTVAQIRNL